MYLSASLLVAFTFASPLQYNSGIRTDIGDVLEWGVLTVNPKKPGIVEFKPSESVLPPSSGCLGIEKPDGFQCQTSFKDIDVNDVKAILAHISTRGTLTQVQLISGPRSKVQVDVPHFAPEAESKRLEPASSNPRSNTYNKGSKKSGSSNTKAYRKGEDEEENDLAEQSFLERNWKYMVPIGIIIALNVFGPKNQNQQQAQ